ncbi:LUD domain-containing protein [Flavitalea sp. BT771]|uniref:LutC/YkgG family protein n=1 Tax=Flavitalea sp. BT771 TaxID=3063329 RepID=UPI0026E2EE22|nr:LUD domain-containing protein [Flavitalea sp. BT771]MDO6434124.1 LUD domain-containing protein [Flavitalea sp. BT771]MDV6223024.1 LUD domain-containing protein [Flavitalea sp. BT771]
MKVSSAKENILKKIRQALSQSTPIPFPQSEGHHSVFTPATQDPEIEFAEQFTKLQGKFIFCVDHRELADQLKALVVHSDLTKLYCREDQLKALLKEHAFDAFSPVELKDCDAAVTTCELLIARTGSIVMSAGQVSGRTVSVYAPIHICIAYTDQLVYDIRDGLVALKEKYQGQLPSLITFATGPSRTADIEKTLVVGVHGPKEVYLFLVDRH